jgi:hypothetical protein
MTTIKLKNGSGAPLAGDLVQAEPALDLTNKRLYTEDSGGTVIEVGTNPGEDVTFADNRKAIFGAGSDLQIYHDGANSIIKDNGTGGLILEGTTSTQIKGSSFVILRSLDGENMAVGNANGSFDLYYDNAKKLATTSTGIDVTGTVTADGLLVGATSANYAGVDLTVGDTADIQNGIGIQTSTTGYGYVLFGDGTGASAYVGQINYKHDDNYMAFHTAGSEKMRIDSSGNLLVGTTTNSSSIAGVTAGNSGLITACRSANYSGIFNRLSTDGDIVQFRKDGATVGSIGTVAGDMFVGTSSTGVRFLDANNEIIPITVSSGGGSTDGTISLGGSPYRFKDLYLSGDVNLANDSHIQFASSACRIEGTSSGADHIKFITNSNEGFRLDSSGNLLVGTTSTVDANGVGIHVANNTSLKWSIAAQSVNRGITIRTTGTTGTHYYGFWVYNGTTVGSISSTGSSTAYNTTSDYRLKENVVPLTGATERVKQLNPTRFNFIADADTTVDGFLAHEVADVVPEAITGTKDGMRDEEYEVTPAVYEDVVIPAVLDEEGNEVEAERTEQQLVTEAVMGTRSVPDYQGIDQSKLVPLLVATIQELEARITALESN